MASTTARPISKRCTPRSSSGSWARPANTGRSCMPYRGRRGRRAHSRTAARRGHRPARAAALSFLELAWPRLGVDPVAAGVRVVDGHRFAVEAAGQRGPLLVAQCDAKEVLSGIKLAVEDGPVAPVTVLQRLGLPDESVRPVGWDDIDRDVDADHLTSLWIPALAAPVGVELIRFDELVHTLRERCPWDREQTHDSLRRHLIEEAYEALE